MGTALHRLIADNLDIWTGAIARRSGAGRGASKRLSLYGIEQLRALIFDLAAQGKLVAGEMCPPTKLGPNVELVMGQAPPGDQCNKDGVGTIFVKTGEFGQLYPEVREWTTKPLKLAREGDVLICVVGATIGKLNLAIDCAIGRSVAAIRPKKILDTRYLYFALMPFTLRLRRDARGSAQGVIGKSDLNKVEIRIPSLTEQRQIVAKVNELMALCDAMERESAEALAAHQILVETLLGSLVSTTESTDLLPQWARLETHFDSLFVTEASIDVLRQTIFELAVRGRLVEQDPRDESAEHLLKRLKAERDRSSGESRGKVKTRGRPPSSDRQIFPLPDGWIWTQLGDLAELITSGSRDWSKYLSEDGAKFITMGNLSRGSYELRLDKMHYVQIGDDREGTRTSLQTNDLLISITGDVGNMALIPEGFGEAYINQHTAMVRFLPTMRGRFIPEMLRSPFVQRQFNEPQRGVKNSFRLSDIQEIWLPLPPLAEQRRIVAKVDELMLLCGSLKARIADAAATQRHLADAIVERAAA
jgi:type I restriction enzyme, S subunit